VRERKETVIERLCGGRKREKSEKGKQRDGQNSEMERLASFGHIE
jgi:hypothetical protein